MKMPVILWSRDIFISKEVKQCEISEYIRATKGFRDLIKFNFERLKFQLLQDFEAG